MTCVIVAELLAVGRDRILDYGITFIVRPDKVFAGMIMIAIIGLGSRLFY